MPSARREDLFYELFAFIRRAVLSMVFVHYLLHPILSSYIYQPLAMTGDTVDALDRLGKGVVGNSLPFMRKESWQVHDLLLAIFAVWFGRLVTYVPVNGFWCSARIFGWLQCYRISPSKPGKEEMTLRKKAFFGSIVATPISLVATCLASLTMTGVTPVLDPASRTVLPLAPFWTDAARLAACYVWIDLAIYIIHRYFAHHPFYMPRVHALHHHHHDPWSVAAEHDPLPTGASIFLAVHILPVWILHLHPSLLMCFTMVRMLESYETHSGYDLSSSPLGRLGLFFGRRSRHHFAHHATAPEANYGALWLDILFSTCEDERRAAAAR